MNERRDYDKNGIGWHQDKRRRDYDKEFAAHCINCDLRQEVKTKVSWKHFTIIGAVVGFFIGIGLYIGIPQAIHGAERMIDTSKETLAAVQTVKEKVIELDVKQAIIIRRLDKRRGRDDPD